MVQANLPTENAHEPEEEARQPAAAIKHKKTKRIAFADTSESSVKSNFKELLSQPPQHFTHKQRLQWLQERRGIGLWVQCDSCNSWRYMPQVLDSHDLPDLWYCSMNPDPNFANCSVPEVPLHIREEEDLIHAEYSAGSVVWARLAGWPWWPAMIDDCPDTEQFYWLDGLSDIPTHYNLVFFDGKDVTRAWISPENLKPFTSVNKKDVDIIKHKKYKGRLNVAIKQANNANSLSLSDRLAKYSFIARFKGTIRSPRKIDKRNLKKYQMALKRKFNMEFSSYTSDSDESDTIQIHNVKENPKPNRMVHKNDKNKRKVDNFMNKVIKESTLSTDDFALKDKDVNNNDDIAMNMSQTGNSLLPTEKETLIFSKPINSQELDSYPGNTLNIDNDTSATYVPDTQTENNLEVHIASSNSNDFDF